MLLGRYRYWGCGLDQAPVPQTIQTPDPDLSKGVEPDLWTGIQYNMGKLWRVDVWSSDGCMCFGFLLCSYSPCQAAKQQTVVKPRCQAAKLSTCFLPNCVQAATSQERGSDS